MSGYKNKLIAGFAIFGTFSMLFGIGAGIWAFIVSPFDTSLKLSIVCIVALVSGYHFLGAVPDVADGDEKDKP